MHLLVLRFSAIGDVALSIPVITAFTQQYPDAKISIVSRPAFRSLFKSLNVQFIPTDFKQKHKGLAGLKKLQTQLQSELEPTHVLDLHGVLRSNIIAGLFRLAGTPVFKIDKGRNEKKALTRKYQKVREPLRHSLLRYADVFAAAGFPLKLSSENFPVPPFNSSEADKLWQKMQLEAPVVGVAPFAGFPGKSWPVTKMDKLLAMLMKSGKQVVLFGGPDDAAQLEVLAKTSKGIYSIAGALNFAGEIAFMQKLQLMISMDSSNMHLATLAGIPVVSIWGATHPYAGFGALGNNAKFISEVPVETLSCRPCSVFGNKPCYRKDYACLHWLQPEDVMRKIELALAK